MSEEPILERITSPHQLRRLTAGQLNQLAAEIRERIIDVVSSSGGHLASNLGIAELTIALHYVFDFSRDRLLWDVGHQCYPHKLLTGRNGRFGSLRQPGGLSGFPSPSESQYDLFATGHAGTAISTAAGLAWADQLSKSDTKVIAVVGDASIVNGLAVEGINNLSLLNRQFLVILNDNSMAIDRTSGAMAHALDRIRLAKSYTGIKQKTESVLQHMPLGQEISGAIKNLKAGLKTTIHGGRVFEALGLEYFGPIDGHNIPELIRVLKRVAEIDKPVLLHVHTQKGRGAEYALEDPCRFHSPSAYRIEDGKAVFEPAEWPSWTKVFGDALADLGKRDERVVAITAAMPDGTGLVRFRRDFPSRYIDVGISESHAVAMAGGLAKAGLRPVVAIYSTFMQRAFDQVFQEACLQKLPVILCMDRSGLVGSDGAVHHGFGDIAFLRPLPGIVILAPADKAEMKACLDFSIAQEGPVAIRYPRDEVAMSLGDSCPPFELGKARVVLDGGEPPADEASPAGEAISTPAANAISPKADGVFLCLGTMVEPAISAARILRSEDGLSLAVVNARFAKPLDTVLISRIIASGKPVVIAEDHAIMGGFGSAVLELAASRGLDASNVRLLGIPDRFIAHASRQEQLTECGLDATNLAATMKDLVVQADTGLRIAGRGLRATPKPLSGGGGRIP